MFCKHCGAQISDKARFCSKCGREQGALVETQQSEIMNAQQFSQADITSNHDVMVLYLNQVRVMECSVTALENKIRQTKYTIANLGCAGNIAEPQKRHIDEMGGAIEGGLTFGGIALVVALISSFLYKYIPVGLFSGVRGLAYAVVAICAIVILISFAKQLSSNQEMEQKYQQDMRAYEEALDADKKRIATEKELKRDLQEQCYKTEKNCEQAKEILHRLYSVNILPSQFRNIYAVYYLYDYLSSSQASFESALLHFNLEEIKSKLDTIITQQQEIILQQAVMISQNEKVIAQNEQILQHAISTERNTARAAQYAEISAANTEAIAFTNTVMAYEMTGILY